MQVDVKMKTDVGRFTALANRLRGFGKASAEALPNLSIAVDAMAQETRVEWMRIARESDIPNKKEYVAGLEAGGSIERTGPFSAVVTNTAAEASKMVRSGIAPGTDMRNAPFNLLRVRRPHSGPIRQGKHGKYRYIPLGQSGGSIGPSIAGKVGRDGVVTKSGLESLLRRSPSANRRFVARQQAVNRVRAKRGQPKLTKAQMVMRFAGITRAVHATYGKSGFTKKATKVEAGEGYQTIRTISEGGDGWRHPGFAPKRFPEEAVKNLARRRKEIMKSALYLDLTNALREG